MGIIDFCALEAREYASAVGRRGSSFIFLHCRSPYRAWLFVHFSSLPFALSGLALHSFFFAAPKKNEPKRRGLQSGKRTRPMASNSFSRGGRHRKRHLHNPQGTMDTCTQNWEKNPGYAFRLLFPGQETQAEGLFYIVISSIHYIKG